MQGRSPWQKLEKEETAVVVTKTKALMFHKIGDVARLSTDSIIITYFIDLLQKLHRGLHQQVQQEVLCQKQHDDLEFYQRDLQLRDLRFRQSGCYGVP